MRRALQLALLCALCGSVAGAQEITLPLVEPREFGLLVRAEVKGPTTPARTVLLFVDTGASYTHLDSRFLDLPRAKRKLRTMTGSGETELRVLEPVTLTLGGKPFDIETLDVALAAHREHCACAVAGVLGRDVLGRFASFTVDFEGMTLRLQQRAARSGATSNAVSSVICFVAWMASPLNVESTTYRLIQATNCGYCKIIRHRSRLPHSA